MARQRDEEPQEEGPGAARTGNVKPRPAAEPTFGGLLAEPPVRQQGFEPGLLDQLMAQYADAPAPGQSMGISLEQPVFRSTPEEQQAATAKTNAAVADLKQLPAQAQSEAQTRQTATRQAIDADMQAASQHQREYQDIVDNDVKPLQAEAKRLGEQHAEAVKARDDYQIRMQGALQDMDTMGKRIAAEAPRDFWADASVPMRAATMILSALGGANQVLQGDKTNAITDVITNMVQRDVMLQKMRFEKNENDYRNQQTMVGQLSQHFDRLEHAQDAAFVTGMQGIMGRLNAIKPTLDSAKMRQNLDIQNAQFEMKFAEAATRVQTDMMGKAVRAGEVVTHTALEQEKMTRTADKASASAKVAAQREARLSAKAAQDRTALVVPGYEFPGGFEGRADEAKALRDGEATTTKVDRAMQELQKFLEQTDLSQYVDPEKQSQYKALHARLLEAARGPGFGQTGSRLTQMLKDLEEGAFAEGPAGRLLSANGVRRIKEARKMIWENAREAVKVRGGQPILKGPGHHDIFGDD